MSSVESAVRGAAYNLNQKLERQWKREREIALGWCGVGRVLVDDA